MKVVIIDNYDSFTYNLYQYVGEVLARQHALAESSLIVKRNDEITVAELEKLQPERIILSPGPGSPDDRAYFGVCGDVIVQLGKYIPVFGVCLGMQGIVHCLGGRVVRAPLPMHGKVSTICHDGRGVFHGMPQQLDIMRYHSLMVEASTLPACFEITSVVTDQAEPGDFHRQALAGAEIMGIRHREYPIEGVQFHPESFATEGGQALLRNFLLNE